MEIDGDNMTFDYDDTPVADIFAALTGGVTASKPKRKPKPRKFNRIIRPADVVIRMKSEAILSINCTNESYNAVRNILSKLPSLPCEFPGELEGRTIKQLIHAGHVVSQFADSLIEYDGLNTRTANVIYIDLIALLKTEDLKSADEYKQFLLQLCTEIKELISVLELDVYVQLDYLINKDD